MCKKPFHKGVFSFGCGQCTPCRVNRRRLWTHRMMLESLKQPESSFLTLTYAKDALPANASLAPKDTQDFLKRLRKHFAPLKLRYFLVGEYGDESFRPHYHMALFGLGPNSLGGWDGKGEPLKSIWGKGHVYAGDLTKDSAQYIAGYVTKKMTKGDDPRLCGRHPEFARMSLRPGLAATAMTDLASVLFTEVGQSSLALTGDVPSVLQHGKKKWPLGRYLRRKLREAVGFASLDTPEAAMQKLSKDLQKLYKIAIFGAESPEEGLKGLAEVEAQKILQLETRNKIYSKKGVL